MMAVNGDDADYILFEKYYNELKKAADESAPTKKCEEAKLTPCPAAGSEEDDLVMKLKDEARSAFLKKKNDQLLDHVQLKQLWSLLQRHCATAGDDASSGRNFMDYKQFCLARSEAGAKAKRFFTATVFAKLQRGDVTGRVPVEAFFNYVMRKTWLWQNRISLSLYDVVGDGCLTERDLELYVTELLPSLVQLRRMETSFQPFYVCSVVRHFMFFLDKKRLGKVRIVDILASGFLDDLLELREPVEVRDSNDESADMSGDVQVVGADNWFSLSNALSMYGRYVNLDTNRNGMLSREELMQWDGATLTEEFVTRLFQEHLTYEGEMDYKAYLDFVLAMQNMKHPSSLRYFFKVLDVRQQSRIDAFALNFFFRGIQRALLEQDQPSIEFQDIKDEIFDMVRPKNQNFITLKDLIDCGQGETVVSILIDVNGFLSYENREFSENLSDVGFSDL